MAWVSLVLAAAVVGTIVTVALCGWGGAITKVQKLGLLAIAGGIVWAGPGRYLGLKPGPGDLLFMAGLLDYLLATYGPALWRRADEADGRRDGRLVHPRLMRPTDR